jgi:hypothetical protein
VLVNIIEGLVLPAVSSVTSPVTVTVPVVIVISCLTLVPEPVKATVPALKVPAPTASVFKSPVFALGMVMVPETDKVPPEPMLRVLLYAPAWKLRVAHAELALTPTV